MSDVQAQALPLVLEGNDAIVKARTGTGKTLAFLIPIAEKLRYRKSKAGGGIGAVVVTPTRELVLQIAEEARLLLGYHGLSVQSSFGGKDFRFKQQALTDEPCDVLVATPGRLQEHMDADPALWDRLQRIQFLVLDEADQLMGKGPWKMPKGNAKEPILTKMGRLLEELPPPEDRQGLLFSATFPEEVSKVAEMALKEEHLEVDLVGQTEAPTPKSVEQSYAVIPTGAMLGALWTAVRSETERGGKVVVFFPNVRLCQYHAELFRLAGVNITEMHPKKTPAQRTRAWHSFRSATSGVLFTSDVSARGVDYPSVTAVIQAGAPTSRDMYVHRAGRTGRGGSRGSSLLLLYQLEEHFLDEVSDLPIERLDYSGLLDNATVPSLSAEVLAQVPRHLAVKAYTAWLGHYNVRRRSADSSDEDLVSEAADFARSIGALGPDGSPPAILRKLASQMGLSGVRGLKVTSSNPFD